VAAAVVEVSGEEQGIKCDALMKDVEYQKIFKRKNSTHYIYNVMVGKVINVEKQIF